MYTLALRGNSALSGQGLVFEGNQLTASFDFAGTPLPGSFFGLRSFEWTVGERIVRDQATVAMVGGAYSLYLPAQADVGAAISVSMALPFDGVTYAARYPGQLSVVNVNDLPQGTVRIEGDAGRAGNVLSAVADLSDEDGLGAFGYQWLADGRPVAGAAGPTLTVGEGEAGKTITVVVSYVDGFGQAESVASDADPGKVHVNTPGQVGITGTVAAGQVVHAQVADPDHDGQIYYQWQVADATGGYQDVAGAWGSGYQVGAAAPVRVLTTWADRYGVVENRSAALGTDGADRLVASGDKDFVMAMGGDDLIGHIGRGHRIDGGAGLDTFTTGHARYLFGQSQEHPGQWLVADIIDASNPLRLTNVERVHFGSGSDGVALDYDGHAGQAYRLYQAAFDRTPDKIGQGFWMNRLDIGVSLLDIANAFVASSEFQVLYGATPTNAEIVEKFYLNVLDRAPDPASRFWIDVLDSKRATVAEVLLGFSESAENIAALIGVAGRGIDFTPYAVA